MASSDNVLESLETLSPEDGDWESDEFVEDEGLLDEHEALLETKLYPPENVDKSHFINGLGGRTPKDQVTSGFTWKWRPPSFTQTVTREPFKNQKPTDPQNFNLGTANLLDIFLLFYPLHLLEMLVVWSNKSAKKKQNKILLESHLPTHGLSSLSFSSLSLKERE